MTGAVRETVTLAGRAERARVARGFVDGVLGPGHRCGDVAALLVDELFVNSILHSGSGAPAFGPGGFPGTRAGGLRDRSADFERSWKLTSVDASAAPLVASWRSAFCRCGSWPEPPCRRYATSRPRALPWWPGSTRVIARVIGELAETAAAEAAAVLRNGCRAVPRALSGRMRGWLRRG
jgi:hypothetical protein